MLTYPPLPPVLARNSRPQPPLPALPGAPVAERVAAVRALLAQLVAEDHAAGMSARQRFICRDCGHVRSQPGAVPAGGGWRCHACATTYYVARARAASCPAEASRYDNEV